VPQLFADYALWCSSLAVASDPSPSVPSFAEHLELIAAHVSDTPFVGAKGEARDFVESILAAARHALVAAPAAPQTANLNATTTPHHLAYLSAALGGHRNAAWDVVQQAKRDGYSLARIYRELAIGTQRRLGELWARAEITVAQEHMASSVTQAVISRLYAEIPRGRPVGRVLMVGAIGERHSLPAQLAADLLELEGWDVAFVGTDVPTRSVIAAIETERPDVVGISATMPFSLPGAVALVRALQAKFAELRLVLGGTAFHRAHGLARELRLDVVAGDAFAAVGGSFTSPRSA
jgi:methanogenic corrinoid protein MtbC1